MSGPASRIPRIVVIALVASSLVACSFTATSRPGSKDPGQAPECTPSRAAPILDTVFGLAGATFAGYMFTRDCEGGGGCGVRVLGGGFGLLNALLWGSSAIFGYMRTGDCIAAHAKHRQYLLGTGKADPPSPTVPSK